MDYDIVYSKRKTVGISVKSGKVTVRAPRGYSQSGIEKILKKHALWIERAIARDAARRASEPMLTESDIKELRAAAKAYFGEKCRIFADVMGARYTRITITGAKTRFGSCSSKKSISFSYFLMLYPEAAREYVIVHELAHIFEMNHSARFYAIVEKFMPDYKQRRALLKRKSKP